MSDGLGYDQTAKHRFKGRFEASARVSGRPSGRENAGIHAVSRVENMVPQANFVAFHGLPGRNVLDAGTASAGFNAGTGTDPTGCVNVKTPEFMSFRF